MVVLGCYRRVLRRCPTKTCHHYHLGHHRNLHTLAAAPNRQNPQVDHGLVPGRQRENLDLVPGANTVDHRHGHRVRQDHVADPGPEVTVADQDHTTPDPDHVLDLVHTILVAGHVREVILGTDGECTTDVVVSEVGTMTAVHTINPGSKPTRTHAVITAVEAVTTETAATLTEITVTTEVAVADRSITITAADVHVAVSVVTTIVTSVIVGMTGVAAGITHVTDR